MMNYTDTYKQAYADMMTDVVGILHDIAEAEGYENHSNIALMARRDAVADILAKAYNLIGVNAVRTSI